MLLLMTLALVVASAVLLVLGFVQDTLGFIYLSMLCAGVAALALFVFARLARRRSAVLAGAGVAAGGGLPEGTSRTGRRRSPGPASGTGADDDRDAAGALRAAGADSGIDAPASGWVADDGDALDDADSEAPWRPDAATATHPVVAGPTATAARPEEPEAGTEPWPDEDWSDWGDEVVFPIEDYDELRVSEILPLLSQLEPDELQEVRDRELSGKARATVLDRIDDRLGRPRRSSRAAGAAAGPATEPAPSGSKPAAGTTRTSRGSRAARNAPAPARTPATRKKAAGEVPAEPAPAEPAPKPAPKKASAKKATARKAPAAGGTAKKAPGARRPAAAPGPDEDTIAAAPADTVGTGTGEAEETAPAPARKAGGRRGPAKKSS